MKEKKRAGVNVLQGVKAGVLGLGKTGLSCIDYLLSCGASVVAFDSREELAGYQGIVEKYSDICIKLGAFSAADFLGLELLVVSPGIDCRQVAIMEAIDHGVKVVGDVELYCRESKVPRVAITGSNAKTTVTTLVGRMVAKVCLDTRLAGNIGLPVLSILMDRRNEVISADNGIGADCSGSFRSGCCDVLELSSFQLETVESLQAEVAVILNLSPDHLDRYDSMKDYVAAKQRIYQGARRIVHNRSDQQTQPSIDIGPNVERFSFGLDEPIGKNEAGLVEGKLVCGEQELACLSELRQRALHQIENALAASVIAYALGVPLSVIRQELLGFEGLPHRCQLVSERDGVGWYNDSKGTNVGATVAALEGFGNFANDQAPNIVLIAGGVAKDAEFTDLNEPVKRYVKKVLLLGEAAPLIQQHLNEVDPLSIETVDSLVRAVERADEITEQGDAVLLSPACASFDMFDGYEDRGRQFVLAVENLESRSKN